MRGAWVAEMKSKLFSECIPQQDKVPGGAGIASAGHRKHCGRTRHHTTAHLKRVIVGARWTSVVFCFKSGSLLSSAWQTWWPPCLCPLHRASCTAEVAPSTTSKRVHDRLSPSAVTGRFPPVCTFSCQSSSHGHFKLLYFEPRRVDQ